MQQGIIADLIDAGEASQAPAILRIVNWHLRGHRPTRLSSFSRAVQARCLQIRPHVLISTGPAPLDHHCLKVLNQIGICTVNYSTDDPWNPSHYAPWFMRALPHYQLVFTPRQANLSQFRSLGVGHVDYLPFAYDPKLHFLDRPCDAGDHATFASDVLFVGGGDADRAPLFGSLRRAGIQVALYGSYWNRYAETQDLGRGQADVQTIRRATAAAKVCLCLVRRANRDGHVMRSYEIAACGGCLLAEDTPDHRRLFGAEGEGALYFSHPREMVEKAQWLLEHPEDRDRLARTAHQRVTRGANTYGDRLKTMLEVAMEVSA